MDNKKKKTDPKDNQSRQPNRQKKSTGVDKINEKVETNRNKQLQDQTKQTKTPTTVTKVEKAIPAKPNKGTNSKPKEKSVTKKK